MRVVICSAVLALLAAVTPAALAASGAHTGTLTGTTKINTGCPVADEGVSCNPWKPLPHARFTITRLNAQGGAIAGTTRALESDADADFSLRLHAGSYLVTPAGSNESRGGGSIRIHLGTGSSATISLHFVATHPRV